MKFSKQSAFLGHVFNIEGLKASHRYLNNLSIFKDKILEAFQ